MFEHEIATGDAPADLGFRTGGPETLHLPSMQGRLDRYRRLAECDAPVLILGETGCGKTALAQWLHEHSVRRDRKFVIRGCGGFHDDAFVATLFGHVRGGYTGAVRDEEGLLRGCDGGTLVLDDIDALTDQQQTRLLHFLDHGVVTPLGAPNIIHSADVRVLATTNQDLKAAAELGRFREDLYYRLAVFTARVPPLRERSGDIETLVRGFERQMQTRYPAVAAERRLSNGLLRLLSLYPWPGNIRELRSAVYQTLAHVPPVSGRVIEIADFLKIAEDPDGNFDILLAIRNRAQRDDDTLRRVLSASGWNVSLTARIANFSRTTLHHKIKQNNWRREREC